MVLYFIIYVNMYLLASSFISIFSFVVVIAVFDYIFVACKSLLVQIGRIFVNLVDHNKPSNMNIHAFHPLKAFRNKAYHT